MRIAITLLLLAISCATDGDNLYALERDADAVVHPGEIYRACEADADCTIVDATCNGCCTVAAISSELEDRYTGERKAACEGWNGGQCDCQPSTAVARCVAGACAEVQP